MQLPSKIIDLSMHLENEVVSDPEAQAHFTIDKIEGANLAESENAPEGFLEWCKKNGALF